MDAEGGEAEEGAEDEVRRMGTAVYFHASVTRKSVLQMIEHLHQAQVEAVTHNAPQLTLFIHSEGGDAYAGLSGMNHIANMRVPVVTVADGFVASAATFLLLGGSHRQIVPHASVLIHQLSTGFWGKYDELVDELANSTQLMDSIRRLYQERTSLDKKMLNKLLRKELTLTAADAVTYRIVDAIRS